MMTDLFDRDDLPLPHCLALQLADPAIPTAELCHLHNLTPTELAALAAHPDVAEQLSPVPCSLSPKSTLSFDDLTIRALLSRHTNSTLARRRPSATVPA